MSAVCGSGFIPYPTRKPSKKRDKNLGVHKRVAYCNMTFKEFLSFNQDDFVHF